MKPTSVFGDRGQDRRMLPGRDVPQERLGGFVRGAVSGGPLGRPGLDWVRAPAPGFTIEPGRPGDHPEIYRLLSTLQRQPTEAEYQAQQDDPSYQPHDRILLRRGNELVGHIRILLREMRVADLPMPIGLLADHVLLPEYGGLGLEGQLLAAAEAELLRSGARLAFARTQTPGSWDACGWVAGPPVTFSRAAAHSILSHLRRQPLGREESLLNPRYHIRLWRHVEQAALARLYAESTKNLQGTLFRSDANWRWLLERRAYDRIYIAVQGPEGLAAEHSSDAIVGYAAMRDGRMVELMTAEAHESAAEQLLERACSDTSERNIHEVRFFGPVGHAVHELFAAAGGERHHEVVSPKGTCMMKILEPGQFLVAIHGKLLERAGARSLHVPLDLGWQISQRKFNVALTAQDVRLVPGRLGRSYLQSGPSHFTYLLTGLCGAREELAAGRLAASTKTAIETAIGLFPELPWWRSPWDELQA